MSTPKTLYLLYKAINTHQMFNETANYKGYNSGGLWMFEEQEPEQYKGHHTSCLGLQHAKRALYN